MVDIWAKIGVAVKKVAETTKDVLLLVPKALIYPIKKPFASLDEMKHDAKVALQEAVSMDVPEKEREYDSSIKITKASENLSIKIISYKDGKIKFLASRTLVGDVSHLSPKQLGQMKEVLPNVDVFREENKVVIKVDVEKITKDIKNNPEHKGKSPEKIKRLVLKGIYDEVDRNLKDLAEITGGELKVQTDRKLLHGIAEKLYKEYDGQNKSAGAAKSSEQSSETAVPKKPLNTIEPNNEIITQNNMTNPLLAYYQEVADGKMSGVKFPLKEQQDILEKLGSGLSNLEDASDKEKKPLSTPTVEGNEGRGKGGRPF